MTDTKKHFTVIGTIDYEKGKKYEGKGRVQHGHLLRKGDEIGQIDSFEIYVGSPDSDRGLRLEIGEPLMLPDLMVELALSQPDDSESATDFMRRLGFRDDLAEAFEKAALRLRSEPRS